jgi:hypothetical protein
MKYLLALGLLGVASAGEISCDRAVEALHTKSEYQDPPLDAPFKLCAPEFADTGEYSNAIMKFDDVNCDSAITNDQILDCLENQGPGITTVQHLAKFCCYTCGDLLGEFGITDPTNQNNECINQDSDHTWQSWTPIAEQYFVDCYATSTHENPLDRDDRSMRYACYSPVYGDNNNFIYEYCCGDSGDSNAASGDSSAPAAAAPDDSGTCQALADSNDAEGYIEAQCCSC